MRVVVVGDVLLERDFDGSPTGTWPDCMAPVVEVESRISRAGGAGLIARFVVEEGNDVTLVTALSDDAAASELRSCFVGVDVLAGELRGPTPVRSRVFAARRPIVRLDEGGVRCGLPSSPAGVTAALESADVIVVVDCGRGLVADPTLRAALEARNQATPLVWHRHLHGPDPIPGVTVATTNLEEAADRFELTEFAVQGVPYLGSMLRGLWQAGAVAVRLEDGGVWLQLDQGISTHVRARLTPIGGMGGADDRFAAALACVLPSTDSVLSAVEEAVNKTVLFLLAGGVDAMKPMPSAAHREGA